MWFLLANHANPISAHFPAHIHGNFYHRNQKVAESRNLWALNIWSYAVYDITLCDNVYGLFIEGFIFHKFQDFTNLFIKNYSMHGSGFSYSRIYFSRISSITLKLVKYESLENMSYTVQDTLGPGIIIIILN